MTAVAALISTLLLQVAPVQHISVNWNILLTHDMTSVPEKGEPDVPSREMMANVGESMIAQVVLTEEESRFVFSVSNCVNGISRLETSANVSIELPVAEQIDRFRSIKVAVSNLQAACAVASVDPFDGNFSNLLTALVARDEAYRAARAKWLTTRLDVNGKKRAN
ncbi:hypothetical protein [Sphingomonas sp. CFBP 8760]|uniref:hypothetical protein n=1 Tax=Sphingomonas sp. CFBP 8760 TaxID=2775282 RepID=UPI00177CFF8E|nr:hypothetical protein [Sphingomonas sp. CFBP 8760]MBD8548740.1 hypothetical protein [Sphingomonas sp. CFBP 8760]